MDNDQPTKPESASPSETLPAAPTVIVPTAPASQSAPPVPASLPSTPLATMSTPSLNVDEPEAPLPEQTVLNEAPADMPALPHPMPSRRPVLRVILMAFIAAIAVVAVVVGAYQFGNTKGYTRGKKVAQPAAAPATLKVPADATIVAQCTAGEGTQYISPNDIPMGPIYNVWKGKVVGLEYMLPESDIASDKGLDLSAMSAEFNHVDVMYEPSGHAGLTEPHYHILLSNLSYAQEKQITCGGSSADPHMMNMDGM